MDVTTATDSGPACNALTLAGAPSVELIRLAEAAPTLAGGALVAGTYVRTAWVAYSGVGGAAGPTGSRRQTTVVLSAVTATSATMQSVDALNGGAPAPLNGTIALSGSTANFSFSCPSTSTLRRAYAVLTGPTRIQFFSSSNGELETFTLASELGDAGAIPDAGAAVDGGCVSIVNTAPVVTSRNVIGGTLPTPVGGTLRDGRYHLTDLYYTRSATVRQQQLTVVVTGSEFQVIDTRPGSTENRARGTFIFAGNTLTSQSTCPAAPPATPITYTATDSSLTLVNAADQRVEVLTRQ